MRQLNFAIVLFPFVLHLTYENILCVFTLFYIQPLSKEHRVKFILTKTTLSIKPSDILPEFFIENPLV